MKKKTINEIDYNSVKAKIISNYNLVIERYPRDHILHNYLNKITVGIIQMIILLLEHKELLELLKKDVKKGIENETKRI